LKYGLPEPIFEEASGSLVVTLRKYRVSDEDLEKLNERQKSGRLSERTGKDNFG
jgi:predicted HTH transcriptional regulator